MTLTSESTSGSPGHAPKSLRVLAEYLELSLDEGKALVMMRRGADLFSIHLGDPAGEEELPGRGTIAAAIGNEILELTQSGINKISVEGQMYRFFRSFAPVAEIGAVVFTLA